MGGGILFDARGTAAFNDHTINGLSLSQTYDLYNALGAVPRYDPTIKGSAIALSDVGGQIGQPGHPAATVGDVVAYIALSKQLAQAGDSVREQYALSSARENIYLWASQNNLIVPGGSDGKGALTDMYIATTATDLFMGPPSEGGLLLIRGGSGSIASELESTASPFVPIGTQSGKSLSIAMEGALSEANFAQNKIRADRAFSADGQKAYSDLAGRPINTVDDLADALKSGEIKPNQLPIDYVDMNGTRLILNTRTSTALEQAGIPRDQWFGRNRTGEVAFGTKTFDELAADQLKANKLPPTGADKLKSVKP